MVRKMFWGSEEAEQEVKGSTCSPGNDKKGDNGLVDSIENTVFYYSPVDTKPILELNKTLVKVSADLISKYGEYAPPIELRIHSYGGYITDAFAAADAIRGCKLPVHTVIEGGAASAATLMSVVGAKRFMKRYAYILIHQLRGVCWGRYDELQDDMKNKDEFHRRIKEIYLEYTKVPEERLEEILKHDLWWNTETAMEYGLVDAIVD